MNKFYGIGNLVADVKATEVGKSKVAKFKVAVQRAFKNERGEHDVDFLNCVAWDKKADILEQYTKKGSKIAIIGNVRTGSYEKDGKKVYTTEIFVDEIELLGTKAEKAENELTEIPVDDLGDNLPF